MNTISQLAPHASGMTLDEKALKAAGSSHLDEGAVTPAFRQHRDDIVRLLNDALATELVCVLRYKRHHLRRIVQLGGEPDFSPDTLLARSHAEYDTSSDLKAMVKANLVAERIAVEAYRQMIALIGDKDPTTRRMLEGILADEEEHADELKDLLEA